MTMPSGAALSLPTKLALLAASTELVALAIATRFVIVPGLSELAVLTAVLVCVPAAATYFVARFIVGRLTVPVVAAYRRLADGDFTAELPGETAGKDFLGLRDGFRAMADALARTLAEVRRTDGERRRLFADLAHELATPTTTLLGVVAALRSGLGDRDTLLDHLERECARLDRLVADVRELATVEDPGLVLERETCDVGALVTSAVDRLRLAHPDAETVRCEVVEASARIDSPRIEQVVTNLVTNALRHAGPHAIAVRVSCDQDVVTLRVDDAGPGVPIERLQDLGRRLLRLDGAPHRGADGHGLGLSIVRAIAAHHGGEVVFSRSPLGGLCVEVRLPRALDDDQLPRTQQ